MSIGIWQVVLILLIVLILFGAGKLPKVMGDLAKGVRAFKKGLSDDEGEEETAGVKPLTADKSEPSGRVVEGVAVRKDEPSRG
ncbi:Sec-independent protein translocase protein TatA [bacterium HR40]|nr:Sec-independent protein translocase protein TatA [bacterium HR40]